MFDVEKLLQYGPLGLFIVAFCESIFFPIPPDLLLLPLSMVSPKSSLWYAFLTTSASVAGAFAGYYLGRKAGRPLVERFFSPSKVCQIETLFGKYGGWAVGIAAFTPIPFKLFTLGAGIFRVRLWPFFIASVLGRGGRFFLEGGLVFFFGERAQAFLGRNFELMTLALTAVVLLGMWLIPKLTSHKKPGSLLEKAKTHFAGKFEQLTTITRRLGREFLIYAGLALLSLFLLLAILDDMDGSEKIILNDSVGIVIMAVEPILACVPDWVLAAGGYPFLGIFLGSGVFRYAATRLGRAGSGTATSRHYRLMLWLSCILLVFYLVEKALVWYCTYVTGGLEAFPGSQVLVAPSTLVLSGFLLSVGATRAARTRKVLVLTALSFVSLLIVGMRVQRGWMEPAMAAVSCSGSLFLLLMAAAMLKLSEVYSRT